MWFNYIIDLERAWHIIAPPTIRYSDHFLYASIILCARPHVRYLEFGGCPLFGCCNCIIIYGDISWYIEQRPLFGRRPLLGVSINRESTVISFVSPCCFCCSQLSPPMQDVYVQTQQKSSLIPRPPIYLGM